MKILYHHRTRGTDAQRVHILEIVNAFRELGHEVEIVSVVATERQDAEREASEASWKRIVRRIPFAYEIVQLAYNLVGFPWLAAKIINSKADFVYERYSLFCFCGVLAAWITRRPIVLEVNSPFALELSTDNDIRAARFAHWTERAICNAASAVIVVSNPLRRILEQNRVKASKLVLMPNGVNLEHLRSAGDAKAIRRQLGIDGRVVVGFVGWFKQWHGLHTLIDTFDRSDLASKGAVLLLVGDGPAADSLKQTVKQRGLENSVFFTGPISHEQIPPYLNAIDVAVQPAANEYCCPMKIIEYMGLCKTIVAPKQENIQELLPDRAAVMFTPGDADSLADALTRAVTDASLRQRTGKAASEELHSRGMFWARNAERVIALMSTRSGGQSPVIRKSNSFNAQRS
jgi:glycosyltransferase involved in cell wall biosynthesis